MEFLIVTGQSGAGKTRVSNILEDFGYYRIDNMPIQLIGAFIDFGRQDPHYQKIVLVADIRRSADEFLSILRQMQGDGCDCKLIYLEADDETIIRRYKESRRPHPAMRDGESMEQAIVREAKSLQGIRGIADYLFNTSDLLPQDLRARLLSVIEKKEYGVVVSVSTFGYKFGLPKDIDMLFDARFLPNPFYIPELRDKTGLEPEIGDFLYPLPQTREFIGRVNDLVRFVADQCKNDGRSSLSVAVGCTGGRHRSVAVAQSLCRHMEACGFKIDINHRDIDK